MNPCTQLSARASRGRSLLVVASALLAAGLLVLLGWTASRSPAASVLRTVDAMRGEQELADRLSLPAAAVADSVDAMVAGAESEAAEELSVELEVEYDPSPRGPRFDREGHRAYLAMIYAGAELVDLEHFAREVVRRRKTLSEQAFEDQRARGLCNAAVSTNGAPPPRMWDRRPDCRYQLQASTERVDTPGPEVALRYVEYYVREDEYPEVFRASEELRWLEAQIEALGGERPRAR